MLGWIPYITKSMIHLSKRSLCAAVFLILLNPLAMAETLLWGGKPELGIEVEQERPAQTGFANRSITLTPSLVFANRGIDRIELLITGERERELDGTTLNASNLGVRVKKAFPLTDDWGIYFRALAGHSFTPTDRYTYGYTDAAITYEQDAIGFVVGLRVHRTLDGSQAHNVNKIRLGPSIELSQHHEVELRWERAWNARTQARDSDSANIEYTYKF
jgi:hypothetical protein